MYWPKTHEVKSKYKFNLYLNFKIINIDNRSCRKLFFRPLLNQVFHHGNFPKIFNWPCASQKTVWLRQGLFFFQYKGSYNLIRVDSHAKNNLRLFKQDSLTLILYHNAVTWTKWRKMKATPTLIFLVAMSKLVPILSTNVFPAMAAGHAKDFQVYVLEQPWHFSQ